LQPQVCGVQPQPPAGALLASFAAAGALKTESCLSTAPPWQCGQVIFSRSESTMVSNKRCSRSSDIQILA